MLSSNVLSQVFIVKSISRSKKTWQVCLLFPPCLSRPHFISYAFLKYSTEEADLSYLWIPSFNKNKFWKTWDRLAIILLSFIIHFYFYYLEWCQYFPTSIFMPCIVSSTDDRSRVVLEKMEGDLTSDYINASYIPVSFIPLIFRFVHNFLTMLWRFLSWRF